MTLLPAERHRITVPDRQSYDEDPPPLRCCNPTCDRAGTQTHHVVRRSETGGPVRWVAVDGFVMLNEVRICLWCHDALNNHLAWVVFTPEGWAWYGAGLPVRGGGAIQHPKSGRVFVRLGLLRRG